MKLYIKQKVFSIGDKYNIYDEEMQPVFKVEGEIFQLFEKTFHLYDMSEYEIFTIKKNFMLFLANYDIIKRGNVIASVNQEFKFFKHSFKVNAPDGEYILEGDVFAYSFRVIKNGELYAVISKKFLSWGDSYEIDVPRGDNPAFACALLIAIDNCLHNENNNNSSLLGI